MVEILNEVIREDHPRQLRFEQRSTGIEGLSHEDMHRGVFADIECCKEKASEVELELTSSKVSEEAGVAEVR